MGPSPNLPGLNTPGSGFIPKTADDRQSTVNGATSQQRQYRHEPGGNQ